MIFKESVNNLAKYSGATHANIQLIISTNHLQMSISDNGRGFEESELFHSGGLLNMRQRAEEMNGRFNIISGPGKGTFLELSMPYSC